jgi:hypothetical protein
MRTYRDFCRPAHQVVRTVKAPGHLILHRVDQAAERVTGEQRVVQMRGRGRG